MQYHKLVRDRIPEVIESDGKTCIWETLSDTEYLLLLEEKLNEELAEYQQSKSLEELADLLEVVQAVVKARGWTWEELEQVRAEKAAKRGGFEKKILLKEVQETESGLQRSLEAVRRFSWTPRRPCRAAGWGMLAVTVTRHWFSERYCSSTG